MKLLYLDLGGSSGASPELRMRYDVVSVESFLEATQRILTDYFDAFVISDDIKGAPVLSFTAFVHQEAPELPTFFLSNCETDLISVLDSVGPFARPIPRHTESTMIH